MSSIVAVADDTFERIARRVYGSETGAYQIARANPGVSEPIPAGAVVTVPPQLNAPTDQVPAEPASNQDEVILRIDGKRFRFWDRISISRAIDSPPALEYAAVWEPENTAMRETFVPFNYAAVDVSIGGDRHFTGTMLSPRPDVNPKLSAVTGSAYGVTGVLSDCTVPISAYPVEFSNQQLDIIAQALLEPFGIGVLFEAPAGAPFDPQVEIGPEDKITPFLAKLTTQRNMVMGETPDGQAHFLQSTAGGDPVADFQQGQAPAITITPQFNGQEVYSSITGVTPSLAGLTGSDFTVKNPFLNSPLRPLVFEVDDSTGVSLADATNAKMGRMFANMMSWRIQVPTWRDARGDLWRENTTITATSSRAMIYTKTEFLIRSVTLHAEPNARHAELTVVLPGAFAGKIPETLPWLE